MPLLALVLGLVPLAQAQPLGPRIGYVYPAGGRQGATFQAVAGGQSLASATNVYVSGEGVKAAVLEYRRPLTQKEFNDLREKLKELLEKQKTANQSGRRRAGVGGGSAATNVWTAADDKLLAEIRKKLANPPNRQANPAIAETVILQVTLAPDATPGERELRLGTAVGLSNPLRFCVGQLQEFSELAAKAAPERNNAFVPRFGNPSRSGPAETDMAITLPATVNGQITPGDVDRFRFRARQGQRLVAAVSARALIPYLPDAVPGWFQATLALYDAKGKEVAYDDDFRFNPDPVLYYEVPRDGDYVMEIKDSIYRGREDFVYRITLGELPFITGLFPLGGRAGARTAIELKGWNLPVTNLTPEVGAEGPGIYPIVVRQGDRLSNPMPFAIDTLPERLEQEPNNQPESAQAVTLPLIINGRIGRPGDWDVFRFEGRAGEEIYAEVHARRLNSPLDSMLKLTDAAGKPLAFNDDHEDKGAGLTTHHADSRLSATLPANGAYYVHLGDTQRKGGPEYAYRLRLSSPRPDFELRVAPSSLSLRGGATVPLTVYALRKDGYSNEIALALKGAPAGFLVSGARVPAGQDQVRLTLTAPALPQKEPFTLRLEGRATIGGREVVHPAVPAEDMMQAFAYRHLVPAQEFRVAVSGRGAQWGMVRVLSDTPVKIPVGGTARVRLNVPGRAVADRLDLELSEPPEGVSVKNVVSSGFGTEMVLQSDAAKSKSGLKGNLIVNAFAGKTEAPAKPKALGGNRRVMGTLPAIPFEMVKP